MSAGGAAVQWGLPIALSTWAVLFSAWSYKIKNQVVTLMPPCDSVGYHCKNEKNVSYTHRCDSLISQPHERRCVNGSMCSATVCCVNHTHLIYICSEKGCELRVALPDADLCVPSRAVYSLLKIRGGRYILRCS